MVDQHRSKGDIGGQFADPGSGPFHHRDAVHPDAALHRHPVPGDSVQQGMPLFGMARDHQNEPGTSESGAHAVQQPAAVRPRDTDAQQLDHGGQRATDALRYRHGLVTAW